MKINYSFVSRSLIALLFVFAGYNKIMGFEGTVGYIDSLGLPFPMLVTILVIVIEVPVALAFAYGYRLCITGSILAAFTVLATVVAHRDVGTGVNMIMAMKNIAIIGGLMLAMRDCDCGKCPMGKNCEKCKGK
ncbi:DoxX family protein [Candidatus Gracilibacteria bacterium]|nr:DoxX family protein [Candidatus Gracilibacteria bacterium]MCF7898791.1 DoxX family protein [Candidatus Paceibacterota bacterium]